MDLITAIAAVPQLAPYLPWIVLAACIAATVVKPESRLYRVVNSLAINIGQARNATDPKVKK
ncbi:MAG: hypothetical protein RL328_2641 [Acidobacteriota bacterium]|jgi:hypothetical protein